MVHFLLMSLFQHINLCYHSLVFSLIKYILHQIQTTLLVKMKTYQLMMSRCTEINMTSVYLRGSQSNELFLPTHLSPTEEKNIGLWIKDLLISHSLQEYNLKSFLPIFKKKKKKKDKTNKTKHKIHPHLVRHSALASLLVFLSGDMARQKKSFKALNKLCYSATITGNFSLFPWVFFMFLLSVCTQRSAFILESNTSNQALSSKTTPCLYWPQQSFSIVTYSANKLCILKHLLISGQKVEHSDVSSPTNKINIHNNTLWFRSISELSNFTWKSTTSLKPDNIKGSERFIYLTYNITKF